MADYPGTQGLCHLTSTYLPLAGRCIAYVIACSVRLATMALDSFIKRNANGMRAVAEVTNSAPEDVDNLVTAMLIIVFWEILRRSLGRFVTRLALVVAVAAGVFMLLRFSYCLPIVSSLSAW